MASYLDVSRSLDFIGNTIGAHLRRGPKGWEAVEGVGTNLFAARIYRSTQINGWNGGGNNIVPYDAIDFDVGGFTVDRTRPFCIRIPPNVNSVMMQATVRVSGHNGTAYNRISMRKNGAGFSGYGSYAQNNSQAGFLWLPMTTAPIPVAEGDEFQISGGLGDSSTTLLADVSDFNVWAIS